MLSKCANPNCSATFRFLSEGKLYRIDSKAASVRRGARTESNPGRPRIDEYFWLCSSCCLDMTIRIDNNFEISLVRNREISHDSEPEFQTVSAAKNVSFI